MKRRLICLALTVLLIVSLVPTMAFAAENPFTDVPETANGKPYPFYDSILWAVGNGITSGYDDGTFRPNATCTRGHVVTFLWRAAGQPMPKSANNPFWDVTEGSYYYNAVLWAVENGITSGYDDGTFRPDAACTRAHVVTFLWRYDEKPAASGEVNITDLAGLNADFTAAIKWAASNGVVAGYDDGTFRPSAVCTRAHVVTFLYRDINREHGHVHHYTDVVTPPTCTEAGYTTHTCSCGDTHKDSYVAALGHKWDAGKVVKEPTATENGEKLYTCTVCGATKTENMGTTGHVHSYTSVVTPPGCAEQGYTTHTCSCGDSYVDSYVAMVGHKIALRGVKAASCTEAGYSGDYYCTVCGAEFDKGHEIAAKGHDWTETDTVRPSKLKAGSRTFSCKTCGATKSETIPAVDKVLCLLSEKSTETYSVSTWSYEHDEYGNIVSGVLTSSSGTQIGTLTATYFDAARGYRKQTERIMGYLTETTVYDEHSHDIKTQTVTDASGSILTKLENTYNGSGLIVKSVSTDNDVGMIATTEYTYNNEGQLIKEVLVNDYGFDINEQLTTVYTYKNGVLSSSSISGHDYNGNVCSATVTYSYDKNGREIERSSTITAGSGMLQSLDVSFSYDAAGNLVQQINKIDKTTAFTYDYSYTKFGDAYYLTKETVTVVSGSAEQTTTVEYTYGYK